MTNGKNSFLQVVKLPNVRGRVRYISDPKRQENLYATFTNVESKYWSYLSKENQKDFRKSGTDGKCIEARELIIMLSPSLIQYDPDMLLKYFPQSLWRNMMWRWQALCTIIRQKPIFIFI